MKHGILSLHELALWDWKEFVERQSSVEHILREDPAGIHPRMNFASRDHYRRIVEQLARRSPWTTSRSPARASTWRGTRPPRLQERNEPVPLPAAGKRFGSTWAITWSIAGEPRWKPASVTAPPGAPLSGHFLGSVAAGRLLGGDPVGMVSHSDRRSGHQPAVDVRADRRSGGRLIAAGALCRSGGAIRREPGELACHPPVPPRPMMRMDYAAGIPPEHRTLGGRTGAVDLGANGAGSRRPTLNSATWPIRTTICGLP